LTRSGPACIYSRRMPGEGRFALAVSEPAAFAVVELAA
jgi:hypothetical protein